MSSINSISIIGSGNVASHLGETFKNKGLHIDLVYNHSIENGKILATQLNCQFTDDASKITLDSDLYLIALADKHIEDTLCKTNFTNQLIVHTSGSFDSTKLEQFSQRWGCFYPMQTFKKKQAVNLKGSSIFIESKSKEDLAQLRKLCQLINCNNHILNSTQRKQLHIAAIATNNFTYHLYSHIQQYCKKYNLPYSCLEPLLKETLKKIDLQEPFTHQTGPAERNEKQTIENHLKLLANDKYLAEIYSLFSKQITDKHNEL